MAKEIKVIECPKCGSTSKTEIRTDYFRCDSCGTEYYLDNDDININIRQTNTYVPPPTVDLSKSRKIVLIFSGVVFAMVILSSIISAVFRKNNSSSSPGSVVSGGSKEENVSWSSERTLPFVQRGGETPYVLLAGEKSYGWGSDKDSRNGIYAVLFDPVNKKEIKSQKLQESAGNSISTDVDVHRFTDGNIYIIVNKSKIFKMDNASLGITDVTKTIFAGQSALSAGVATVEFVYEDEGDGLKLMTNDGINYYFYPQVNKLYTKDELYKAKGGFKTLLPSAKETTYFSFTSESFDFPNEKTQLLKIVYKDNVGGPKDMETSPRWSKDFGGSGIFTDRDPYKKVLISDYAMERGRVVSFKDLTPGRLYFKPSILYYDDQTLLIKFAADANPNTPFSIQSVDVNTGAVKWTYAAADLNAMDNITRYKNGFIAVDNNEKVLVLDNSGKETNTFKID